jgi:hypothetical protein
MGDEPDILGAIVGAAEDFVDEAAETGSEVTEEILGSCRCRSRRSR